MAIYYVSTSGSDTASGNQTNPWRTIMHAAGQVAAGDTVLVHPGTYAEAVVLTPATSTSGTSGNRITYKALDPNNKPRVHSGLVGRGNQEWLINGLRYITVDGFLFRDSVTRGFIVYNDLGTTSHIELLNCDFIRLKPKPGHIINFRNRAETPNTIDYVTVEGVLLDDCDPSEDTGSGNGVCEFQGNIRYVLFRNNTMQNCWNVGINWLGSNNPIGQNYCNCGQPSYGVFCGNRVLNQRAHQTETHPGPGNAFYSDRGTGPCVWQGNLVTSSTTSQGFVFNVEPYWDTNLNTFEGLILRNNVSVSQHCITTSGDGRSGKGHANCTFYGNAMISDYSTGQRKGPVLLRVSQEDHDFKNNVFWRRSNNPNISVSLCTSSGQEATMRFDGNLWWHSQGQSYAQWLYHDATYTWTTWQGSGRDTNGFFAEPAFASEATGDFRLKAGTTGHGSAVALTTATNSGASSTSLTVDNPYYFIDGYGIIEADRIAVGGTVVEISSIDYATATITLATPITWSTSDPVQLAPGGVELQNIGPWSTVPLCFLAEIPDEEITVDFTVSDGGDTTLPITLQLTDASVPAAGETMVSWEWAIPSPTQENVWEVFSTEQNPTFDIYCAQGYTIRLIACDSAGNCNEETKIPAYTATGQGGGITNRVVNGDFSSGGANWDFVADGPNTIDYSSGAAVVTSVDAGVNTQLRQVGISVTDGEDLVFEVTASANPAKTSVMRLIKDSDPFTNYGLFESVSLQPTAQTFTFPFTCTATDASARLQIRLNATDGSTVTIDDVQLGTETAGGTITASAVVAPLSGDEPLAISMDGTGSTSTNGILSYQWTITDNATGDEVYTGTGSTDSTTLSGGTYTVELLVSGPDGCDTDTDTVTVNTVLTELPSQASSYSMDDRGNVVLDVPFPSWAEGIFTEWGNNRSYRVDTTYNVFTRLGQAENGVQRVLWNIDTGKWQLENSAGIVVTVGTLATLALYGTAKHPKHVNYAGDYGKDYWDWAEQYVTELGRAWPTLMETQYQFAQGL